MRISLVLATLHRTREPRRLLQSLRSQGEPDWDLILVDQNPDDRLDAVLAEFSELPIRRLRADPGASRARNLGLHEAAGDVVGFPDDDCWYPEGLLDRLRHLLSISGDLAGLSGRQVNAEGKPATWFASEAGPVDPFNVWRRTTAATLWAHREALEEVGGFDENLGPGADTPWQAAEDIDLVIRLVQAGKRIHYDPTLEVHHPDPLPAYDDDAVVRGHMYGLGTGRVLRKHDYPPWFVARFLMRPLGGLVVNLAAGRIGRARYHGASLRGRLGGYLVTPPPASAST